MKVLALCHTVIPETENGRINLRASSPDEEALVMAAIKLGVRFQERTPFSAIVNVVSVCTPVKRGSQYDAILSLR